MNKKVALAKNAVRIVVGIGTAKIVQRIIKNNVPTETPLDRVTVTAASYALGGVASDVTGQYTDKTIDQLVEFWEKLTNSQ